MSQALIVSLFVGLMCVTSCDCVQTQPDKSLENAIISASTDNPITDEYNNIIYTAGVATVQNELTDAINDAKLTGIPIAKKILRMPVIENEVTESAVEPEVSTVAVEPETETNDELTMSNADIELIALVTMGEAEGQSELGKRLVIDTVLNRMDHYGDTASEVIYAKGQYTCMWNGRIERCYVRDDIVQLVREELENRTNYEVIYFRTGHYHNFGTRIMVEDEHYFSGF